MKKALWAAATMTLIAVAAYFGLIWIVSRNVSDQMERLVSNNPAVQSISYDKLRIGGGDSFGQVAVHLDRVQVILAGVTTPIPVERATLFNLFGHVNPENEVFHIALTGVAIDPALSPEIHESMRDLGYPALVLDVECLAAYQPEGGRIDIDRLKVAARGMGALAVRLQMENVDIGRFSGDPRQFSPLRLLFALPSATVTAGAVDYTDHSLARRYLSMDSGEGGTLAEWMGSRIDRDLGKEKNEAARAVYMTLREFIHAPERIVLEMHPQHPISFLRLATIRDFSDFIDLARLTVTR